MKGLIVYKMTGSGNDFVMLDGRTTDPERWPAEATRVLCDRRSGIGADAVVFACPGSAPERVRMVYYNSDGSAAPMCGNAALCTTQLAHRLELTHGESIQLETGAGTYQAACVGADRARLRLGRVPAAQSGQSLRLHPGESRWALLTVGVPHLIVVVDDVDAVDVATRGRELRFDAAAGPGGANVNFIAPNSGSRACWRMRTYERGVEAETYACGTGAVAAAAALSAWALGDLPASFLTRSGLVLGVSGRSAGPGGGLDEAWLEGEARLVFRAAIDI